MQGQNIIVLGGSAGGVDALVQVISTLPADLPAAVFVVHHFPPNSVSALPAILTRCGALPAHHPEHGEAIVNGRIYVSRPDYHLLLAPGEVWLGHGPKENGHRPAIDALFRTAARACGPRVTGVLLSGMLDDGASGIYEIKKHGGITIVQDPGDALFSQMPQSALKKVNVDHVLPAADIGAKLVSLVGKAVEHSGDPVMGSEKDNSLLRYEFGTHALATGSFHHPPTGFTCPECGGSLWEVIEGDLVNYRCHVGHGFAQDGLLSELSGALEAALWTALRMMEEKVIFTRRLASNAEKNNFPHAVQRLTAQAERTEQQAGLIRKLLVDVEWPSASA